MNILILSAGTRNKIVQFFKKELAGEGEVVAADCSSEAPAIYEADKAVIVPRIDAPDYIDRIVEICAKENIKGVFSLIDPELSLIAANKDKFAAVGTVPVVSSRELCDYSLDKYRMGGMFRSFGLKTPKCYLTPEEFFGAKAKGKARYPVFVKPRSGSASIDINKVMNEELLRALFHTDPKLIVQEFMQGDEYGADVYVDLMSGVCTHIFLKKKLKMRAGETDKAVSVKDAGLFGKIANFAEGAGFRGMIDIDLFKGDDGWYFSEVNPRFGGGYPHAYACGVNFPRALLNNLRGETNAPSIGDYEEGVTMMKYCETTIKSPGELIR